MTETAPTPAKLESMMAKIQKLIAVADDPATPEEAAATYRQKAESLMRDYRVAEEDLIASDQFSILPVMRKIVVVEGARGEFESEYCSLWYSIARHCGLRSLLRYTAGSVVATAVGYDSDLRYAEFLWSACRLMFASKLEPEVDRSLSDEDNVYNLRSSGLERIRISKLIWGDGSHSNNAKVTRLYAKACAARGEDPAVAGRSVSAKDYRTVYARSFTNGVGRRLREARDAADSIGGAVVLGGRAERIDEAFYELFPTMRPQPRAEGEPAAPRECDACKRTKHESGKCRDCRPRKVTQAERNRFERLYYSETAQRASRAGQTAADGVEIDRVARAKRIAEDTTDEVSGDQQELEA